MAVPTVKYSNVNDYATTVTMNATFSSPTTGNLLFIAGVSPPASLVTTLSGWTKVFNTTYPAGQFFAAYKTSAGTESTVQVSTTTGQGVVFSCEIQGWSGVTPTFGTGIYSSSITTTHPTVTVPGSGGMLLSLVMFEGGYPGTTFTETPPSPVTTASLQSRPWDNASTNCQGLYTYATTSDPQAASSPYTDTLTVTAGNGNTLMGLFWVPGTAAAARIPYQPWSQRAAILAQ